MEQAWLDFRIGDFLAIIMRYSLTFCTLVQYFLALGNLIFFHFRTILNKLKKVISLRYDMCIKASIYLFPTDLSHLIDQMVQILIRSRTLLGGYKSRFWKVLRQINPYVSNKWPLKLPCAYLNTQQSSRN
ncbi:hypothetical protein T08_5872, partial [Trichinella sp. T8]